MTGKEILEEEFEKAGLRGGYKAEQVDAFLQKVAAYVDELNAQNSDCTYKMQILADKIEEYKKDEENIRQALLGAQKLGNSIMSEAKTKADAMTREAKAAADEMLSQAKAKIDSLTRESKQKASMELNALKRESEMEQRNLEKLKQEVSNFKAFLLKQYKAQLQLLTALPSVEDKDESSARGDAARSDSARPEHSRTPSERPASDQAAPQRTSSERTQPEHTPPERTLSERASQPDRPQPEKSEPAESASHAARPIRVEEGSAVQTGGEAPESSAYRPAEPDSAAREIEQEVKEQTKEFGGRPKERPKKQNYAERFGELQFGLYDQHNDTK